MACPVLSHDGAHSTRAMPVRAIRFLARNTVRLMTAIDRPAANLPDIADRHALRQGGKAALRFLGSERALVDAGAAETLTFAELATRSQRMAAALAQMARPGERALLVFPAGLLFPVVFLACLRAGLIPVAADVPRHRAGPDSLRAIARASDCRLFLTDARTRPSLPDLGLPRRDQEASLGRDAPQNTDWIAAEALEAGDPAAFIAPRLDPAATAYLQFTSGTTGTPRGVAISTTALMAQLQQYRARAGADADALTFVSWLPHTHDFGLVGFFLAAIFMGTTCVFMSRDTFLRRPLAWLEAISTYRGSYCGAPAFGYSLCADADPATLTAPLDLSCWRIASLGGDHIDAETLRRFSAAFVPHGFDDRAWLPAYGLAEAVLCATARRGADIHAFDVEGLKHGIARPGRRQAPAIELVSCGLPSHGQIVRIVDPETAQPLEDGSIGEIWVAGTSLAHAYWNVPEDTVATFGATLAGDPGRTFLRTGDCGFLRNGELYITGRRKDILVVHGCNHAPEAIEATIQSVHPALRAGAGVVAQGDPATGGGIVAIQEVARADVSDFDALLEAIAAAVTARHGLALDAICLIRRNSLPRTRSGKLSRHTTLAAWRDSALAVVAHWQRTVRAATARIAAPADADHIAAWLQEEIARTLKGQPPARDDNLLAAGLDSLAAISLLGAIERQFAVAIPLEAFFDTPTTAGLATLIAGEREHRAGEASGSVASTGPIALTQMQAEIRLMPQLRPGTDSLFNLMMVLEIDVRLDPAALTQALIGVARRHDALRTVFPGDLQEVREAAKIAFQDVVLADHVQLIDWLRSERQATFDLEAGPLWRASQVTKGVTSYLVITAHHLIADGASFPVIAAELAAHLTGEGGTLPQPVSFRTYCADLDARNRAADDDLHRTFWQQRLGTTLPDMAPNPPRPLTRPIGYGARVATLVLDAGRRTALVQAGAAVKATLFHTVLTAYALLLHRVSPQDRIVIGLDVADRAGLGEASLVGCTNLVLPVVTSSAPGTSAAARVAEIRAEVIAATRHRAYSMARWARDARIAPDPARPFKIMAAMNWQRFPDRAGPFKPRFDLDVAALGESPFGLALDVRDDGRSLRLDLIYNIDLFAEETVTRYLGYLDTLTDVLARLPERDPMALPMLPDDEVARLVSLGRAESAPPSYRDVLARFHAMVAATPEADAIICPIRRLSYRALADQARLIAGMIRSCATPGSIVALLATRSARFAAAILGIWEAGCIYLPLDPKDPEARLSDHLAQTGAVLLLHDAGHRATAAVIAAAAGRSVATLDLDTAADAPDADGAPIAVTPASKDQPAYLLFTSGTTGTPKAAIVSHGGMVNHLEAKISALALCNADRIAQSAPQTFDISIWQFLAPLVVGGQVIVLPDAVTHDPRELFLAVEANAVTVLEVVPSVLRPAIDFLLEPDVRCTLKALRWLISTGEPLAADTCRRWISRFPTVPVMNAYGPTECSDDVTHHIAEWPPEPGVLRVPIGRPIPGADLYVLDATGNLAPTGVAGELYVGGPCVGLGYFGDAERTAVAFVPDHVSGRPGARLYRTGDLVRFLPDGALDYLGRIDRQVKINGVRIEPREVEAAIQRDPAIESSLVTAARLDGRERLIAYVVFRPGLTSTEGAIKAAARKILPPALVPARFLVLDAMPLSANGKIDTARLPPPSPLPRTRHAVGPANAIEAFVHDLWSETLAVPGPFHPEDDFFELGGSSLEAATIARRVENRFDIRLPVAVIFRSPTIAGLASAIAALTPKGGSQGDDIHR